MNKKVYATTWPLPLQNQRTTLVQKKGCFRIQVSAGSGEGGSQNMIKKQGFYSMTAAVILILFLTFFTDFHDVMPTIAF